MARASKPHVYLVWVGSPGMEWLSHECIWGLRRKALDAASHMSVGCGPGC